MGSLILDFPAIPQVGIIVARFITTDGDYPAGRLFVTHNADLPLLPERSFRVQHQYDYDQGLINDSFDKNGEYIGGQDSPAEQRAMKNEDKAREQEGLKKRRTY